MRTGTATIAHAAPARTDQRDAEFPVRTLRRAAACWFAVTAIGQLLFVAYLSAFYGRAALRSDWADWNKVVPHAYVPGDTAGNLAMGVHVLIAAIIIVAGLLQLIPTLRQRAPLFHRISGRIYVALSVATSVAGLYMVWFRGGVGDLTQHIGISGDALLIMLCAFMAVRHARARRLAKHREWALRLFMVVSAVWFFRIGLTFWILLNQAPVGFDPVGFKGPTLSILSFANYLLPLAVLELYLRAERNGSALARFSMAAGLGTLTLATGVGIFAASVMLWLPRV